MDERALPFARELEQRDEALAAAIADVGELQRATDELRADAERLAALLAGLPDERDAARSAVERAQEELERRRPDVERAASEVEAAERTGRSERAEAASRGLERARDALGLAESRLARVEEELAAVDGREQQARAQVRAIHERAGALAAQLSSLPRVSREGAEPPAPGLDGAIAWASRARAALWVVRSGLESERERVVREANELGASVLGEPLVATSVTRVREQLERAAS